MTDKEIRLRRIEITEEIDNLMTTCDTMEKWQTVRKKINDLLIEDEKIKKLLKK